MALAVYLGQSARRRVCIKGSMKIAPGQVHCLLGYSVGHRRAHERCVSHRAASLRAWGGRGAAVAGKAAFGRASLVRNACWACVRHALGKMLSEQKCLGISLEGPQPRGA